MSPTTESLPAVRSGAERSIALVPLGLSLSTFLMITFLLCVIAEYIPVLDRLHFLRALFPDIDWTQPAMIGLGALWAFLFGWYVALVFGSLRNFFAPKAR